MKLLHFDQKIHLPENTSPDNPITLFTIYYISEIIDIIIKYTNNYIRELKDNSRLYTRANKQYPTNREELYIFFTIRIYITLYINNEISDYWNKSNFIPKHEITKYINRNRFQEFYIRVRLAGTETDGLYIKVSKALLILLLFFVRF